MTTSTAVLHGIPNCDTVKKARTWLESNGVDYTFHDFKKQGVSAEMLAGWLKHVALATLLNRKGTTWRALSDADRARAENEADAIALIQANPSLIKQPVLVHGKTVNVGFSADQYANLF
ncbi:arsenate reductase [Ralstonia syzygii subsp. celebesensis]|uniref:Arsenate reductase n=1 Tax=blood disease bacterium A2-HR MARDI TaxID=1944648 RepID=A0A1U9VDI4_9RALS|nr:arsenate reductase [Ralstonia syzygii]AQW28718.1 arsenate reductase [blood disease bacterium A2-HR MARDI]QQV54737.1 arsenate reductase [Ralstonia syzygii subsp. celebesensis]